ncbi:recombinase family protein [Enterobacter roggenkampii]|uniref:recombinase family protein n=1 Tax=Enterobacter roggenkampii TaxID=1812935 RepID=UPI001C6FEE45|nr:recombinase family protein [Enterobacter roggenkampii]MBW9464610.1 recombinase family protein [Enterobacter roggenkampii]
MNIKTAFCYCRVSSGRQKTEMGGFGMSRQQALLTSYVDEYEDKNNLGYKLSVDQMVFLNAESVSGFSGKNIEPGSVLHCFITDYKNGNIKNSVLIIENVDRFSRINPNEAAELFLGLINSGCDIHEVDTETVHHRTSDLNQISAGLSRSHKESLRKQKLSLKNWDKRFEKTVKDKVPLTERCPGWLKVTNGTYHVIPERIAPIQLIFKLYNDGFGQAYIRDKLNNDGYHYNDKTWSSWSIHRVLKDVRVTGKHKTQSLLRNNYDGILMYPVIISDIDFKLAEQRLNKPGRDKKINRRANTVFSGLLICGVCKTAHILINNEQGKRFGRCSYANAGNNRCLASGFKYNVVEHALLNHLRHLDFGKLNIKNHNAEMEKLNDDLIYHKNYLLKVQKLVDADDLPSERDYLLLKKLEIKIREIEGKIHDIKNIENVNVSYSDIKSKINDDLLDVNNIKGRQEFNVNIRKIIREIQIFKSQPALVFVSVSFYASQDLQWLSISLKDGTVFSNTYIENESVTITLGDKLLTYDTKQKQYFIDGKPINNQEALSMIQK